MVHTLPPWTTKYRMVTVFGQIDTGELAARLGSMSLRDRRGNIVWYDDFKGTSLKWYTLELGGAAAYTISIDTSHLGDTSLKIVTGNTLDDNGNILAILPLPGTSKWGVEGYFRIPQADAHVEIYMDIYTGSRKYRAVAKFLSNNTILQYLNSGNTYTELGRGWYVNDTFFGWQNLKLVFDYETKKYIRIVFNDTVYDMANIALYSTPSEAAKHARVVISVQTLAAAAKTFYVDSVMVTQNET